jgi:hypothetical protein
MAPRKLKEFAGSDQLSSTADPIPMNSARPADKQDGEKEIPWNTFMSRAEAMQAMTSLMSGFPLSRIADIYKGLSDTIKPEQGARPADQHGGEMAPVVTSPTAVTGIANEDIDAIFQGETLTEELKDRAKTVMEAVIGTRILMEREILEEQYAAKLEEQTSQILESVQEQIDQYLSFAAGEFVWDNALAIENGIKNEIVENFMVGLKNLFHENYVDVPDEQVDAMALLVDKLEDLETKYNDLVNRNVSLTRTNEQLEVNRALTEACSGLALTQVEKLRGLTSGITYTDSKDFKQKLGVLKETYFPSKPGKAAETVTTMLTETTEPEDDQENVVAQTPEMQAAVDLISRTVKK